MVPALRFAPQQRRRLFWPVLGLIALGVCGLAALGLASTEIGVVGVVVGALCALLPVGPVVAAFLWVDRWEPEPPRLLLAAFLWGAGLAALSALVINSSAVLVGDLVLGQGRGNALGATVSAPIVEEFIKGAFVVGLLIRRRREFDGVVDGVVYAGITAAGFAFTENIVYFGRAFAEGGTAPAGAVLATFVLRGILSPFAHPLFTSMLGVGVGIAANARSRAAGVAAVLVGFVLAVVLHALWNAAAQLGPGFFGIYLLIMVPLFLALTGLVVWQRRREQGVLARQMPGFAGAGWIAGSEVALLSSMAGRRRWEHAVRRRSGRGAARAVSRYQHAVTELAFLRSRAERGAVEPRPEWHSELLDALLLARADAVNAPGAPMAAGPGSGPGAPPDPGAAGPGPHGPSQHGPGQRGPGPHGPGQHPAAGPRRPGPPAAGPGPYAPGPYRDGPHRDGPYPGAPYPDGPTPGAPTAPGPPPAPRHGPPPTR